MVERALQHSAGRRRCGTAQGQLGRLGRLAVCAALLLGGGAATAKEAVPLAADPVLEARVMELAVELRCLVCQNQTIADSHADLALDLRQQIREQLQAGRSSDEIRRYMTDRYGDFVLYRPPLNLATALLWVGPAMLMVGALVALFVALRRRQRLGAEAFDPETPEPIELIEPGAEPAPARAADAPRSPLPPAR